MGERILVYGVTGSGKSTLAAAISRRTGLPWHSMDDLTWEPGWIEVPAEEQRRRVADVCAGENWIIDTAYSQWLDIVLARTDTIVALDYPRWVSLTRLLRRTFMRLVDRRPICNGNTETWRQALSRNSIIVWHSGHSRGSARASGAGRKSSTGADSSTCAHPGRPSGGWALLPCPCRRCWDRAGSCGDS